MPPASQNFLAFGFFARNSYLCTVMQGDTASAQAKRASGRKTVQNRWKSARLAPRAIRMALRIFISGV